MSNRPSLKPFILYRSSAGSGKTRTLAKEYLRWALSNNASYFRHILAVTFANKATQEMKERVLRYLWDFIKKDNDPLALELRKELGQSDDDFKRNSKELLTEILHHYSQFSVSTIDAFFQRVLRAFTRETGLLGDYRLEVENDAVFVEVIDNLIYELKPDEELTRWVVEFASVSLDEDKSWDIRRGLVKFAAELYRDEFRFVEKNVRKVASTPGFFRTFREDLLKVRSAFHKTLQRPSLEFLEILRANHISGEDLKYKGSGLEAFVQSWARKTPPRELKAPGDRMRTDLTSPSEWATKNSTRRQQIVSLAERDLVVRLKELVNLFDAGHKQIASVDLVLENLHVFGLLSDISRKLIEYKSENNIMLLADAPALLHGIIGGSDTPFVYERVGSFYRHYLIDEFQDTSNLQWTNFLPLVTNNLDEGNASMVVGDVKQAIYRWRGGDLALLQERVASDVGSERTETRELNYNYRSSGQIVTFNNALFTELAASLAIEAGPLAADVYHDVSQKATKQSEGFVNVDMLSKSESQTWKELALERMTQRIESLQELGFSLGDIAILVRKNEEGQEIATHLLEYQSSGKGKPNCKYDVVSNESLRIQGAASVNVLLGAMRYLLNADDGIARAQLSFEFARLFKKNLNKAEVFAIASQATFESYLPDEFTSEKLSLRKLPLFELTETLIRIFDLGKIQGELAYLQSFQDLVLEYYHRNRNDLAAFLGWWEENKNKEATSIRISGEVEAIRILTIHKAKGLQFRFVIIPFCQWSDRDGFNATNMWVKASEPPFDRAGFVPVKYSSALKETYFHATYEQERARKFLDTLNELYVALTRAEQGMILFVPDHKSGAHKNTIAKWLNDCIPNSPELASHWNPLRNEFRLGEWPASIKKTKESNAGVLKLHTYPSHRWRDKLVIQQTGYSFFEGQVPEWRERINYGMYLHAVLSQIIRREDIPSALDKVQGEGVFAIAERSTLEKLLNELMLDPSISGWFSDDWNAQTEVSILLPQGRASRIDRLLVKNKKAVVVDFKTGEKTSADRKQVKEYMEILQKMGFNEVEGYLLYLNEKEVVPVGETKPAKPKGKVKGQLGLDF